jgi:hypothetical protein
MVPGAAFICMASLRVNVRNTSSDGFAVFGHRQQPEIGGSRLSPDDHILYFIFDYDFMRVEKPLAVADFQREHRIVRVQQAGSVRSALRRSSQH